MVVFPTHTHTASDFLKENFSMLLSIRSQTVRLFKKNVKN